MAINTIDNFSYKGKKFLDDRTSFKTTQEMNDVDPNTIPRGFKGFDEEAGVWKMWIEDEHGDLGWRAEGTGTGSAGSAEFTKEGNTVIGVGGIQTGTTLKGKTTNEILEMMLFPYQKPEARVSINPATTLYEVGATATLTVSMALTKKTENITAAKITKDGADLKVASEPEITAGSLSQANVQITTNTTFSGSVNDSKGANAANSIAVKFTRRSYFDVVAHDTVIDSAQKIEALGKNQLTGSKGLTYNNLTANNQKIVYAYPASFGDLTSIKDGNGFDNLASGWTKTIVQRGGVDYNVYTLNDPMSITGGKLIFA